MYSNSWDGRVKQLNSAPSDPAGRYVLYWMQAALRTQTNPALDLSVHKANEAGLPLVVLFNLMPDYPEAQLRHFAFLVEGVEEVWESLRELGAHPVLRIGDPMTAVNQLSGDAREVVLDRGYLKQQRHWYRSLAKSLSKSLCQVEGEVVVPLETASTKAEYAARTIRPRIHRHLDDFLVPTQACQNLSVRAAEGSGPAEGPSPTQVRENLADYVGTQGVGPVSHLFQGGPKAAQERLHRFLSDHLGDYDDKRNHPHLDQTSTLSPYLHFGMISPLQISWTVMNALPRDNPSRQSFLEELIVRRSLAQNTCLYDDLYDSYEGLPEWARKTLHLHREDARPHLTTPEQLEQAQTHDPYWNAAQIEMVETGFMHNYMRMYWGKKILEWSESPELAYQTTLRLNNKYFLDGRDPASFTNVGWIFGLHDRPWQERAIYGKVRCMMASGLERKTKPCEYVRKVSKRTGRGVPESQLTL